MAKLTPKQKAFAAEYLVDLNAAAAATRAGYSERTARAKGYVLLQNPDIQAEIRAGMENRAKRLEISQDMVIQELARIAFFNATRAARVVNSQYGARVEFTDTGELTDDERAAIASIEETKHGIKVSSYDKVRALELLGKHLGLFDKAAGATPPGRYRGVREGDEADAGGTGGAICQRGIIMRLHSARFLRSS